MKFPTPTHGKDVDSQSYQLVFFAIRSPPINLIFSLNLIAQIIWFGANKFML